MSAASLTAVLFCAHVFVLAAAQRCKFGEEQSCLYKCNCNVTCDPQTGCLGSCNPVWDGPTCQRRNVALFQTTRQSSTAQFTFPGSQHAVDGILGHSVVGTPCTHTGFGDNSPWWEVTLDKIYPIYRFQIYNRDGIDQGRFGARLNGFRLSVGNSSQNTATCYTDRTTDQYGPGDIITGRCESGSAIAGNIVKIGIPREYLTLCEVQLFVCSDGWYGEKCERECKTDVNCSRCDNGKTRCEECVAGRWGEDCLNDCGHCWNNNPCNKQNGECPDDTPRCGAGFYGSHCVQTCANGVWGADCSRTCGGCHDGNACNTTSGDCPLIPGNPRCEIGHTGARCEPCIKGTWGAGCNRTCGGCHGGNTCSAASGDCPLISGNPRCTIGYTGDTCEPCESGTWGEECANNCSATCVDLHCHVTTGACLRGENKLKEEDPADHTGAIIGSVVGVIVIVVIVVIVAVCVLKYRSRSGGKSPDSSSCVTSSNQQLGAITTGSNSEQYLGNTGNKTGQEPATYENCVTEEEHTYEPVYDKEYSKIQFSNRDQESNYTTLA